VMLVLLIAMPHLLDALVGIHSIDIMVLLLLLLLEMLVMAMVHHHRRLQVLIHCHVVLARVENRPPWLLLLLVLPMMGL